MRVITGNRGEWSEIYALFKLLGDKTLFAGDADLNKIENIFYPIIKIIRKEYLENLEFVLNGDLVFILGGKEELRIPVSLFSEKAVQLLALIKKSTGAFGLPEIESFMHSIYCYSLKAKSSSKTDIRIVIHDPRINQSTELGFSIKSQLGNDATLLNAGRTTNFIYLVQGMNLTIDELRKINNIETRSKIKDRLDAIKKLGGVLVFDRLEQSLFMNNLILIDSSLPNILAEILNSFYSSALSSVKSLTAQVQKANSLNYDYQYGHSFYEYKIKRFLVDVALGMTPSKVWGGLYDATGGYLVIKEDGDVLCYHIYNRNKFEDYLFENTKLETASSSRHGFGQLYEKKGSCYFNLNLQVRFK